MGSGATLLRYKLRLTHNDQTKAAFLYSAKRSSLLQVSVRFRWLHQGVEEESESFFFKNIFQTKVLMKKVDCCNISLQKKLFRNVPTYFCGLYYKHVTIVNDDSSGVGKRVSSLLMTLESSFAIVIVLYYRPLILVYSITNGSK